MDRKTIFDVGLHKGEDTEYYLARGYRVIAIEADPDLVSFCRAKFEKPLWSGDLVIVSGAVVEDDHRQSVKFYKNRKESVWGTAVKEWAARNERLGAVSDEIDVPVVDFPRLLETYGCPHYLKIDIEGMDLACLRKLLATNCRPKYVSIESEKRDFAALTKEFDVLHRLGYKKFFIQQQETTAARVVPHDTVEGPFVDYQFTPGSSGLFGSDLGPKWLSKDAALRQYKQIYREYKYFGDRSALARLPFGRQILERLSRIVRRPLPGWYDTHASL